MLVEFVHYINSINYVCSGYIPDISIELSQQYDDNAAVEHVEWTLVRYCIVVCSITCD